MGATNAAILSVGVVVFVAVLAYICLRNCQRSPLCNGDIWRGQCSSRAGTHHDRDDFQPSGRPASGFEMSVLPSWRPVDLQTSGRHLYPARYTGYHPGAAAIWSSTAADQLDTATPFLAGNGCRADVLPSSPLHQSEALLAIESRHRRLLQRQRMLEDAHRFVDITSEDEARPHFRRSERQQRLREQRSDAPLRTVRSRSPDAISALPPTTEDGNVQ